MPTVTLKQRILQELTRGQTRGQQELDDDQLASRLGVVRQAVNQSCRQLHQQGLIQRRTGASGKIVNSLRTETDPVASAAALAEPQPPPTTSDRITEDDVKHAISKYLEDHGFTVTVAWGRTRGIDIDASRGSDRLIIEAKAEVPNPPQQVNYFLNALGELVQRMNDPNARYGLALPDNRQYRGLVDRLPPLARARLGLNVYFVRRSGTEFHVVVDQPD